MAFDFVDGGAEDGVTLRANRASFGRLTFAPRAFGGARKRLLSTTVDETRLEFPLILGPAGLTRIACRRGELDAVDAAGRCGLPYVLSTSASTTIERGRGASHRSAVVPALTRGAIRRQSPQLVGRARAAGCSALVLTVDVPVSGRRYRDLRNGMTLPPQITARVMLDVARHPRWAADLLRSRPITFENLVDDGRKTAVSLYGYIDRELVNASLGEADVSRIRDMWPGRLLVKGVLGAADARTFRALGADGLIVSNHGGRQLDGAPASLDVLPEVVAAVDDGCPVLIDGGVRHGGTSSRRSRWGLARVSSCARSSTAWPMAERLGRRTPSVCCAQSWMRRWRCPVARASRTLTGPSCGSAAERNGRCDLRRGPTESRRPDVRRRGSAPARRDGV